MLIMQILRTRNKRREKREEMEKGEIRKKQYNKNVGDIEDWKKEDDKKENRGDKKK